MPVHLLSDVDVIAISLVDKGANRKKFYMRKQDDEELFELPRTRILKEDIADWSVAYCVVAEPGHAESPGLGADTELDDQWSSPDEIRRAAHRFMKNGGLVNKMHETLDPYGSVVENFVAQSDFYVNGDVIKAGSWVVGIAPNDEGRKAIENGSFTGVSIQGTGIRTLAKKPGASGPKAKTCPSCGGTVNANMKTCQNCNHSFSVSKVLGPPGTDIARNQVAAKGPLKNLIHHYMKKPHPFAACVRDNRKRFGPDGANRVCATLKDLGEGTTKWRKGPGKKIHKAEDIPDWFVDAWTLRWVNDGFTAEDAVEVLKNLESSSGTVRSDMQTSDRSLLRRIAESVGISKSELDDFVSEDDKEEEDEAVDTATTERLAKMEATLEKSASQVEGLANRIADIAEALAAKKKEEDDEVKKAEVNKEDLSKKLDDITSALDGVRDDVERLAEGSSSQKDTVTVNKSDDPLAGVLLGDF